MKLNEKIRNQIDSYFESITPEHLFEIAVTKYRFIDVGVQFSGSFTSVNTNHLFGKLSEEFLISDEKTFSYTIAA